MEGYLPNWLLDQYAQLSPLTFYITCSAVIITVAYFVLKNRGLPPGPTGVPILGYWPFLKDSECTTQLTELQKKYGDIFSINVAGKLLMCLGSHKALREFHVQHGDCFERVTHYFFLKRIMEHAIALSNGECWRVSRKYGMQQFKEIGMTVFKDSMSDHTFDAIQKTVDKLRSKKEQPVDIIELMTEQFLGIVRRILFGDYGMTQEELKDFIESYNQVISFLSVKGSLLIGNVGRYAILPLQPGYREAVKNAAKIQKMLKVVVEKHKRNPQESNCNNFIDNWLKEAKLRQSKNDPTAKYFTEKALVDNLNQIAGDIGMTVAAYVGSFLIYAVQNPKEQEKVYQELVDVVGDRNPTYEDKVKLPYTNAFMWEIQRISNFFPLLLSQQCIKETTIRGYRIPVGSVTLMNEWSCHHDPQVYGDPEVFRPERWLPEDGKPRPELPITFGVGKRSCMGEGYVTVQTFLFFTTLIKNFKFTIPGNATSSFYDVMADFKMEVVAVPRNQK